MISPAGPCRSRGLIVPDKIHNMLRLLTRDRRFEDLPIKRGGGHRSAHREEVVLDRGSVADAVTASLSIPGVFVPWKKRAGSWWMGVW